MARSKKGAKPPGYDYWTKRPYSSHGFGPEVKKWTHRAERIQSKEAVEAGIEETAQLIKERIQAYADQHGISFDEAQKRARINIDGKTYKIGEEDEQD